MTDAQPCVLCTRDKRQDGSQCCAGCQRKLLHQLNDTVDLYAMLPAFLAPGSSAGAPKVSGSREAPLPLRLDVLNLLGAAAGGTVHDPHGDQTGTTPVVERLHSWERDWRETRGLSPGKGPATVTSCTGFLRAQLDWAAREHPAIVEFATELRELVSELRVATGDPRPKPIGTCTNLVDRDGQRVECGHKLYAAPYSDVIRCRACGDRWSRDRWLMLGRIQTQQLAQPG